MRGRDAVEGGLPPGDWEAVHVDVGTGDGRYAYALARAHPGRLVVGVDALRDNLAEMSQKASRKPAKGGLPNVVYVAASAEAPPPELLGVADHVSVMLPWGRLMVGLIAPDADVLRGLAAIAKPNAAMTFVLNAEVWGDPVPVEARDLPEPTPERVLGELAPAYAEQGIEVSEARLMTLDEVKALPTTWAKRLASSRALPRFVYVSASRCA